MGDNTDAVLKALRGAYGGDLALRMSEVACVQPVPTGITAFDYGLLGCGGVPAGHFFELSGREKTGKTTLVLHMIAGFQAMDFVPLVIDPKGAVASDSARAERIGVDPSGVVIVPIDSSEEALQSTREGLKAIRAKGLRVAFCWDDMGLTPSDSEMMPSKDKTTKKDVEKVGAKAKSIWRFCRGLAGSCYKAGAPMVIVNQVQSAINTGWVPRGAPTETTAGGGGLRYTARIRVSLSRGKAVKSGKNVVGQIVYAKTEANAFYTPFRSVMMYLDYRNGYDSASSTLLCAMDRGLVKQSGALYKVRTGARSWSEAFDLSQNKREMAGLEMKLWPQIVGEDAYEDDEEVDEGGEDDAFAETFDDEDWEDEA